MRSVSALFALVLVIFFGGENSFARSQNRDVYSLSYDQNNPCRHPVYQYDPNIGSHTLVACDGNINRAPIPFSPRPTEPECKRVYEFDEGTGQNQLVGCY